MLRGVASLFSEKTWNLPRQTVSCCQLRFGQGGIVKFYRLETTNTRWKEGQATTSKGDIYADRA